MTFNVVAIEIPKEHIGADILEKSGRIYIVSLYNPNEMVYCCEIRPSYWLEALYYVTEKRMPDDDQLFIDLEDSSFYSAAYIDQIVVGHKESRDDWDDQEEALEHYQGNTWEGSVEWFDR